MPVPLPGRLAPYDVALGYHPFVDHRYLHAGQARWMNAVGERPSFWSPNPARAHLMAAHAAVPSGIELRGQTADTSAPFLTAAEPWEHWLVDSALTVIRDAGRYRLWYEAAPPDLFDGLEEGDRAWRGSYGVYLAYAESDDGATWRRPALGLVDWNGSTRNNLVIGRQNAGPGGLVGAGVFLDPTAPASERYKAVFQAHLTDAEAAQAASADPASAQHRPPVGMRLATSPDGLRWHVRPEPLAVYFSDTGNVAEWDPVLGQYVWYARGWCWGRRTIARAATDDLRRCPLPMPFAAQSPVDPATHDIYTNAKTTYPGDPSTHLMFPTLYDRSRDSTRVVAGASADNVEWGWIPGAPCLEPGPAGALDSGCVFAGTGMVELPGDRVAIPYLGYHVGHKHMPAGPTGCIAWATWPRGRLAGLVARAAGEFWTPPLRLHGARLGLNLRTEPGGSVRIGVTDGDFTALDGFTVEHARPIAGDQHAAPVTWGGHERLPVTADRPLALHVRLDRATIFGFEVAA
ncbi:MAG: hypothetical protein FJ029_12995 [Actinobacteria bacterium]|nr:hypothetical protein [Actinomycetota bacterium]